MPGQSCLNRISTSRSREGAWIEIWIIQALLNGTGSRSREGAWIEITNYTGRKAAAGVAPVRERGLKCLFPVLEHDEEGRSREGAWIEI